MCAGDVGVLLWCHAAIVLRKGRQVGTCAKHEAQKKWSMPGMS